MKQIKIILADNSFLIRQGFKAVMKETNNFILVAEAEKAEDLNEKLLLYHPDVLVIDYSSRYFWIDDITVIHEHFPVVNILAITPPQPKTSISKVMEEGVLSHLWKDCGKEEIIEAINSTAKGERYLCGKIVEALVQSKRNTLNALSCDGIRLSSREIEIIRLISDGLVNKQIAEKLFLSSHTIATHRKNIMSKVGVNNSAGLVMFAINQNLIIQPSIAD